MTTTEAATAMLELARSTYEGEILAMIDPRNRPSQNVVAHKAGFRCWKEAVIEGERYKLYDL